VPWQGWHGRVYAARDTKLGRKVAIKVLSSNDQPELTARFIIEAKATARCSHENIIVIYEVGEHAGNPFMVLEYLQGAPLTQFLQDGRRLAAAQTVELNTGAINTTSGDLSHQQAIIERLYAEPGYLGAALRSRARSRNQHILLFIDQFEELYTQVPDPRERLAFTACLAGVCDDVTTPLRLVLSLRSDFPRSRRRGSRAHGRAHPRPALPDPAQPRACATRCSSPPRWPAISSRCRR
jgi:hypothetical protein